ncbi:phy rapidly regulated [Musa troglodytarum]|uniref:Phy rapidly regulated n=1 Tax=Musa troglodytarum TaxID=320322 RepID=A0A9E7FF36_9LILI|nr:phy rapidly regulated [Musa troglodytarum]
MDNQNLHAPSSPERGHARLVERSSRIKMAAEMGLARSSRDRHWSRALRRRLLLLRRGTASDGCGCQNEALTSSKVGGDLGEGANEDEAVEVEARVRALQRLVPGGEELGTERLFEETADYIEALQVQVSAMRALACLLDELRERRG